MPDQMLSNEYVLMFLLVICLAGYVVRADDEYGLMFLLVICLAGYVA